MVLPESTYRIIQPVVVLRSSFMSHEVLCIWYTVYIWYTARLSAVHLVVVLYICAKIPLFGRVLVHRLVHHTGGGTVCGRRARHTRHVAHPAHTFEHLARI